MQSHVELTPQPFHDMLWPILGAGATTPSEWWPISFGHAGFKSGIRHSVIRSAEMADRTPVDLRIARYEAFAHECRQKAKEARADYVRDQYLRLAKQWDELADNLRRRPFL